MAKWMPFNSRPGTFRSRDHSAPPVEQQGVELAAQLVDRDVLPDVRVGDEAHALGFHLLHAAVDEVLLHLEIRNAVAQQAADAVVLLEQA